MKRRKEHKDKRSEEMAYGHTKTGSAFLELMEDKAKPVETVTAKTQDALNFGNIEIPDIDLEGIIDTKPEQNDYVEPETRYIKPRRCRVKSQNIMYENAEQLARDLRLDKDERADCLIAGSFIFGDFIEAYLREQHAKATYMLITTLSLSQNNVDSLHNLMTRGYIDRLDLLVSTYFFANEYHGLVPYIYRQLDIGDRFQMAVADIHTKTCQFTTLGGRHIVMHGSANLRSSANIEQFCIEENETIYNFYAESFGKLIEEFKTIRKPVRGLGAWDVITKKRFED